jgi:N6-L-threonylcarbamoyladenine synthase
MLLALETSCDETSAAVVHEGRVLANVVSSQTALHEEYGGVVPELAAREHLRNLMPIVRVALDQAGVAPNRLDAIAATRGPGLPGALLVGLKAAQALAFALRRPWLGIHHHEAHLYSPWISGQPPHARFLPVQPNVSLIVSGGHTLLARVNAELDHQLLGVTLDDAAGECFDKVGKLLGLPYPAGPHIDRLAREGNPRAYEFPRPLLNDASDDFSFSGLKTAVRYFLRDHPRIIENGQAIRDLCASVQGAIVEVLVVKTLRVARRSRVSWVTASGGVTCNQSLRRELAAACAAEHLQLRLAEKVFCTDNAAMIGILAERKLAHGLPPTDLCADIAPGWALDQNLVLSQ